MVIKLEDRRSSLRHCTGSQKIRKCPPFMAKSQAVPKNQNAPTSISNGSYTILKYPYVYRWWETRFSSALMLNALTSIAIFHRPYIYCRSEGHYSQELLYPSPLSIAPTSNTSGGYTIHKSSYIHRPHPSIYSWWVRRPYIYCRWEAHYFQLLLHGLRKPRHVARWSGLHNM